MISGLIILVVLVLRMMHCIVQLVRVMILVLFCLDINVVMSLLTSS